MRSPADRRRRPGTAWVGVTAARWCGAGERGVEVGTATAVWYHSGLPAVPLRRMPIRDPQGRFATQALFCTDIGAEPPEVLAWFVQRWQLEATLEGPRGHLGVETQRRWSAQAIRRTTPALLGLFSLVTLLAHRCTTAPAAATRQTAWYRKAHPTFTDALALVRRKMWPHQAFPPSLCDREVVKVPLWVVDRPSETLCHAA